MLIALSLLNAHAADVLPVQRIRFYETGVAWFEREGTVTSATSLPVPTSHLDDAIKTLVVLGGDVELGAITFPTALGDDAARVKAGLQPAEQMGFRDALTALLGVAVTLETGETDMSGVLIDIEGPLQVVQATGAEKSEMLAEQYALTLLDDKGVLHRTTTSDITAIHSDEAEVTERLATAARTLARTRAQRPNALDVQLEKGGRLGLGYLAESAVWRVSYRILDAEDGTADLQAWALVHNDTDEAWRDVQIELANGEPDSFLYPLAAPRYADRELRTPPVDLATVSQLTTATPDEMWNESSKGGYGVGYGGYGSGGGGSSAAMGGIGTIGTVAAALKTAEPVETPTQFVYRIPTPVDLAPHHTALVPIVQEGVPAEPLVAFEPHSTFARSGMWLENGTNRTLPSGVLSVLQSGGLAGEARLERLKPGETQMVTFGNELDVDLERTTKTDEALPRELSLVDENLVVASVLPTTHDFDIRNRSGRDRALWFALPLTHDEQLATEVRSEIDRHNGWTWIVLDATPGEQTRTVQTEKPQNETFAPAAVLVETWESWSELGLADATILTRAAELRTQMERLDAQRGELDAEKSRAQSELAGLRATLTAADGSNAASPVTRRATAVEAEIRKLESRQSDLDEKKQALVQQQLDVLSPLADGSAEAD